MGCVVLQGPLHEGVDVGHEAAAEGSEGIFYAGRDFGKEAARYKAGGFEGAEGLGEHFRGDVGNGFDNFVEAGGGVLGQHAQDEHGPLAGKTGHDVADGATVDAGIFFKIFF